MTKAQKQKLIDKYMVKYPEITDYQKEWCRKTTAQWIYVQRDETGRHIAHCTCCDNDIDVGKTKHLGKIKCPVCNKELEVIHDWRIKYFNDVKFVAIPKAINSKELMLRYVLVERNKSTINNPIIREVARHIVTEKTAHTFEMDGLNHWNYSICRWFAEYNMYNYRTYCCMNAIEYTPLLTRELRKIDKLKYFTPDMIKDLWQDRYYNHHNILALTYHSKLYEKLLKADISDLAILLMTATLKGNRDAISYNRDATTLTGMLGINKTQLKILRKHQSFLGLHILQKCSNANEETIKLALNVKADSHNIDSISKATSLNKAFRYIIKQEISVNEYSHYVDTLVRNEYPIDDAYLFPRNFREFENIISEEIRVKNETGKNALIKKIADGLTNNEELREFFTGSNGLVVYVPETAEELRREGKKLHNCLGTYIDRFAEGKTLIFFIRKIEEPDSPYVAMEYCHGRVIQCRQDFNANAEDKVIDFAEALARKLQKLDILAA